ncbi:MAG: hypothetical protein SGILL_009524, partial [Bacillariaceae sp.]
FGTRGGSAWRLLYVLTLMPWLKKYRAGVRQMDYTSMGDFGSSLKTGQTKTLGYAETGETEAAEQPQPVKKKKSKAKKSSTISDREESAADPSSGTSEKKRKKKKKEKGPSIASYNSSDFVATPP